MLIFGNRSGRVSKGFLEIVKKSSPLNAIKTGKKEKIVAISFIIGVCCGCLLLTEYKDGGIRLSQIKRIAHFFHQLMKPTD